MNEIVISNNLVTKYFEFNPTGLNVIGTPTLEVWLACGKFIDSAEKSVHLWIGDWLNYGELHWGESYKQASETTGFDVQTLRNDKWIASRVAPERRKEGLKFDHYATVADLDEEEQEELLTKAVEDKLNTVQFRKFVKHQDMVADKKQPVPPVSAFETAIAMGDEFLKSLHQLSKVTLSHDDYEELSHLLEDISNATANIQYETTV